MNVKSYLQRKKPLFLIMATIMQKIADIESEVFIPIFKAI